MDTAEADGNVIAAGVWSQTKALDKSKSSLMARDESQRIINILTVHPEGNMNHTSSQSIPEMLRYFILN